MAGRLPLLSGQAIVKLLNKAGYQAVRQRGSHIRLEAPRRQPVTVPDYKQIDRSLLRKILRDANISVAEFLKLQRK